jgi:hypothetical protein
MTEVEWAEWNRPFPIYPDGTLRFGSTGHRAATVLSYLDPPRGYPCFDCPVEFHLAQRAAGSCDGEPRETGGRRLTYPADVARARRLEQWREYRKRKRAKERAIA